ncbi:hypothetical protein QOT17_022567 [Balamuthia mandrillaris]
MEIFVEASSFAPSPGSGATSLFTTASCNYSSASRFSTEEEDVPEAELSVPPSEETPSPPPSQSEVSDPQEQAAMLLWEEGKAEEAIAKMEECARSRPSDSLKLEKLADMHLATGNYNTAIDLYQRCRSMVEAQQQSDTVLQQSSPSSDTTLMSIPKRCSLLVVKQGECEERSGHAESARRHYKDALELWNDCSAAHQRLGFMHLDNGEAEEAEKHFTEGVAALQRTVGSKPDKGDQWVAAELMYGRGKARMAQARWNDATDDFEKSIALSGVEYAPSMSAKGDCLLRMKRYAEAIAAYSLFYEKYPDYYERFSADTIEQLQHSPIFYDTVLKRATAYIELGDTDMALLDLATVITAADDSPRHRALALYYRAKCQQRQGEWWGVIHDTSNALKTDPSLFQCYWDRAIAFEALGEEDRAKEDRARFELAQREKRFH